jgi:uncharacterized protein
MKTGFTSADLDRLESWLLAPERVGSALPPDAMQGLLCAVVSAPSPLMASRWYPAALGEGHQFESQDEAREMLELLMAFHNDVARQLNAGEGMEFVLYGDDGTDEAHASLALWCEGYLMGVELADPSWDSKATPEELERMLFPFYALSGRLKEAAVEAGEWTMDPTEERRMLDDLERTLVDDIMDNRRFWFEKAYPETVRHAAPKVGRNAPCPCGSGKKHKNCCGRG